MLRSCNVLKLSRIVRDNVTGLTNHVLVTSGLSFKLSRKHEKSDDNVLSVTKQLIIKTFLDFVTDVSVPYLVLHLDVLGSSNVSIKFSLPNLGCTQENTMVSFHMYRKNK